MSSIKWNKDQIKLAFHLYCQTPFGRIHSRNAEIILLSHIIERTPSAVAMKMLNLASLDPAIVSSGRSALGNASSLDREVWAEFHHDWEKLALECELFLQENGQTVGEESSITEDNNILNLENYIGETKKVVSEQRLKQHFFRRAILSSYSGRCCISGLAESRLLVASHIVPWSKDKSNRLNPSNGLCLSSIHDQAFDKGLITLTDDLKIVLSAEIKKQKEDFVKVTFLAFAGKTIELPEKFRPELSFIAYHRENIFVG